MFTRPMEWQYSRQASNSWPDSMDLPRPTEHRSRTNAPTGLTATQGTNKIVISWNAVSGATNYNISRATTIGGPYTVIKYNTTATSYTDTSVVAGTTYYYEVSWNASAGGSLPSGPVTPSDNTTDTPAMPPWGLAILAVLLLITATKFLPERSAAPATSQRPYRSC